MGGRQGEITPDVPIVPKQGILEGMPQSRDEQERILDTAARRSRLRVLANQVIVPLANVVSKPT